MEELFGATAQKPHETANRSLPPVDELVLICYTRAMGFFVNYRCDRCRRRLSTNDADDSYYYVLPDGREVPLATHNAWCDRCRRFVLAENDPFFQCNEARIDRFRQRIEDGLMRESSQPDRPEFAQWPTVMLEWWKLRQSPPKCLSCGSANIISLDNCSELIHPRCGGKFARVGEPCHSNLCSLNTIRFGVEGPPLARDTFRNRCRFAKARFIDWCHYALLARQSPPPNEPRLGDFFKGNR